MAATTMSAEPLYGESLPIPSGWFCIGPASDYPRGAVTTRRLCGREIVVFHTSDGRLAALDAHCPHLGAHMGKGGRVEGDAIRCPFHGFCFDASGTCTKTAYGSHPPRNLRARAYPVLVLHGIALAYYHPRGIEPSWRPEGADMEGWPPFRFHRWTLRGHPQETTENSVDIGHFGVVHGYRGFHERTPVKASGPHLFAAYDFHRPTLRLLGRELSFHEAIDIDVWGLGYSRVHVTDLSLGLDLRLLVLATPLDADHIELRIGLSVRDFRASPRVPAGLRWVPRAMTDRLLARVLLRIYRGELEQDLAIWRHKQYVDRPALAVGDGPVALYRRWARQFYDDPSSVA
jgi:phenylpropionate dioxygenase-like ring-hydroxylating dioxygenase large terminal subunit